MSRDSIFHLLYASRATLEMTDSLLNQILSAAQKRNPMDGVTGFLTARDGFFMQLIEGPEEKVRNLFRLIHKDPRHSQVRILGETFSRERIFPNWSMGYVAPEKIASRSEELLDLFVLAAESGRYESPESIETILRIFSKDLLPLKSV